VYARDNAELTAGGLTAVVDGAIKREVFWADVDEFVDAG
jgi:hypothetical protein